MESKKLLDTVIEREDKLIAAVKKEQSKNIPVYIYGASLGAKNVEIILHQNGLTHAGMLVDKEYLGGGASCLEDVLEKAQGKISLVVAHQGYTAGKLRKHTDKISKVIDLDGFAGVQEDESLTYPWVAEHEAELQWLYDAVSDDLSRQTLSAYLNQKISRDYKYLTAVKQEHQYFEDGLVPLGSQEVFVDCGAYDGDSAVAFIDALHRRGISTYQEIVSFEPDTENFQRMTERSLENHTCIAAGCAEEKATLRFKHDGTSSAMDDAGEQIIEVDSIDHVLAGKPATMIKMDIEGSELSALKGARDTICRYQPKLAICIYHKKADLLEIPQYIHALVPSYQFYIRAYENYCTEIVLYAFPKKRSGNLSSQAM